MPKFPSTITSKLPKAGTTIFSVMSKLATEYKAINLSQGFPDFSCDQALVDLVTKYMKRGFNQYAPMAGVTALREQIAETTEQLYGAVYDAGSEITVTAGATQAIYTIITALIRENDEVLIFEPAYDCYVPAIELNGGKAIYYQLQAPYYKIDWNDVQKLVNHHTKMIIINTPHNPTGTILAETDLKCLEKLTKDTDIVIVSDEVYEHIVFDEHKHQSVALFPKLAERSFIVSSFGKTFHTTGWKVGYCLAPQELMDEFRKVHQFLIFSVSTPMQYAIAEYLKEKSNYLQLGAFYQTKRDYFNQLIRNSRFSCYPSAGTYFQLLGYERISEEKDTEYAVRLVKESGLACIPVSVFYHEGADFKMLRFCFAKQDDTLEKAAEILCKI
jgi:methionine aminotransferase